MAILGKTKVDPNPLKNIDNSVLRDKLDKLVDEYDEAVATAKTKPQRDAIMRMHKERLMDLGMRCKLEDETDVQRRVDKMIDSLETRMYRPKYNRY